MPRAANGRPYIFFQGEIATGGKAALAMTHGRCCGSALFLPFFVKMPKNITYYTMPIAFSSKEDYTIGGVKHYK